MGGKLRCVTPPIFVLTIPFRIAVPKLTGNTVIQYIKKKPCAIPAVTDRTLDRQPRLTLADRDCETDASHLWPRNSYFADFLLS